MIYDEAAEVQFCQRVADVVLRDYDLEDGGDLCFTLLERGTIPEDASIAQAARIVAQHLLQA